MEKVNYEQMFQSNSPSILSIDGSVMNALKIACDEFAENGEDMREFNIIISEKINETNEKNEAEGIFTVTFMGKLTPGPLWEF